MTGTNEEQLTNYFIGLDSSERDFILKKLPPEESSYIMSLIRQHIGRQDPVWWIEDTFGITLWDKQKEIVLSVRDNKRTAVASCHAAGKSFTSAVVCMWFLFCHKNSTVITTAPTARQVEQVLWKEIRSAFKSARYPLPGEMLLKSITIDDKWRAFGFSTDVGDAFQGHHSEDILVVFDEASGVEPPIWDSAHGVFTGANSRFLTIGNPTDPSSRFKQECDSPVTNTIYISAFETPNIKKFNITKETFENYEWKDTNKFLREVCGVNNDQELRKILPFPALADPIWLFDSYFRLRPTNPMFEARVEGKFPDQGEGSLIPVSWIMRALENWETTPPTLPHEFGVDVAYLGQDENVVVERCGARAKILKKWSGLTTIDTAQNIINLVEINKPERIKIDMIGYGAGVADMLEKKYGTSRLIRINGSESATDPVVVNSFFHEKQFYNYRAEMYWLLRERFERGEIALCPDDVDLIDQLKDIQYEIANGKIKIESKDDMRARIGRSTDDADALAYAFAKGKHVPILIIQPPDLFRRSSYSNML